MTYEININAKVTRIDELLILYPKKNVDNVTEFSLYVTLDKK